MFLGDTPTFSSSVKAESFLRAASLVSLMCWLFCCGLDGGEKSVLGVELVLVLSVSIVKVELGVSHSDD